MFQQRSDLETEKKMDVLSLPPRNELLDKGCHNQEQNAAEKPKKYLRLTNDESVGSRQSPLYNKFD
jgi:hypothetical protein